MVATVSNDGGRIVGLVLCGGASRRMGRDKAALRFEGETLLRRAVRAFDGVTDDVRLACGPVERYADEGRPLVVDRFEGGGPLAGIEAALSALAPDDLLVCVACDMPHVDPRVLAALVDRAHASDSLRADVCCARSTSGIEPLLSVWRGAMAVPARAALERGERRVVAAFEHPLADGRKPRVVACGASDLGLDVDPCTRNLNSPEDVALAAREDGAR